MLLSGNRHLADTARCRELGVKQYLTKPVGQSELLDAILTALGLGAAEERLIESTVRVPEKPRGRPLNILLSEDNPVNQKLAIRLLEKAGHRVTLASTGREALSGLGKRRHPRIRRRADGYPDAGDGRHGSHRGDSGT